MVVCEFAVVKFFAVAEADLEGFVFWWVAAEPMEICEVDGIAGFFFVVLVGDEDEVFGRVFGDDVPRSAREADAFALADCVVEKSVVLGDDFVGVVVDEVAFLTAEVGVKEVFVFEFAEEANALAVFAVLIGKVVLCGELADFGFCEVADWENDFLELLLAESG